MAAGDPRIGQLIGERYQLMEKIGEGGQCVVYNAFDVIDRDRVAVKILKEEMSNDPEVRERMFREARAMTNLSNTAALRVLDQKWTPEGALCLVTELLIGRDLENYLDTIEATGIRLHPNAMFRLLDPIVSTLEQAHDRDIVHRDIKPANIFIIDAAQGGGVRLLDFGFAKFTHLSGLTGANMIAGSPRYIAPETWLGKTDVGPSVDEYAFAAVIFRCLTGAPPFDIADVINLLRAVTKGERPKLTTLRPELPVGVDDWAQRALAVNPEERYGSVLAMWTALHAILKPTMLPPAPPPPPSNPPYS
ncbi:MAG: serine/threonine protein kinase [Polyangiaceae bacterium]|nr:serine/threonine protein kinase [Polyangiaceae bacterium]